MKTLAAALLASMLAADAYADGADLTRDAVPYAQLDHAESVRSQGRVATGLGIAMTALGTGLATWGAVGARHGDPFGIATGIEVAGSIVAVSGGICIASGVPAWVKGVREVKRVPLSLSASAGGLMLKF